jgi:signal recognition particle subunit SRP54
MASLDVYRPAAQEQLAVLGRDHRHRHAADRRRPDSRCRSRSARCRRRKLGGYDIVLLDTAGRTTLDEAHDERRWPR